MVGLGDAIKEKQTVAEFLADLDEVHKAYAQSVYQSQSVNINIAQSSANNNTSGQHSDRDTDYLNAVNSGDTAKAQQMVDEAAKAAGYTYLC